MEDTKLILNYERARDALSIIDGFLEAGDFDADPPDFELVFNDSLETITVLIKGLTYMMHVGSDDDAYTFTLETENTDEAYPRTVVIPIREIATLTFEE
jgi:hypothetical protein